MGLEQGRDQVFSNCIRPERLRGRTVFFPTPSRLEGRWKLILVLLGTLDGGFADWSRDERSIADTQPSALKAPDREDIGRHAGLYGKEWTSEIPGPRQLRAT